MANTQEIADTLLSDDDRTFDCNKSVHKTLEGYAVEPRFKRRRFKRAADGPVFASQLASQLTYLDHELSNTLTFAFAHALNAFYQKLQLTKL